MPGEIRDPDLVELLQPFGFQPSVFLNRLDGAVPLLCDAQSDRVFLCFQLHLELSDAVVRGHLGRRDEFFGFSSRVFEQCLQLDLGLEKATELGRRLGGIVRVVVFPLCRHVQLPVRKVSEGSRSVSSFMDLGSTSESQQ